MDEVVEDYDYDMEEMSMKAPAKERKAAKAKKMRREKIRNLKKLIGADQWEDEDNLEVTELEDTLMNILKFLKDPIVKSEFTIANYKKVHNAIVDAAIILESMEIAEEKMMLKKV